MVFYTGIWDIKQQINDYMPGIKNISSQVRKQTKKLNLGGVTESEKGHLIMFFILTISVLLMSKNENKLKMIAILLFIAASSEIMQMLTLTRNGNIRDFTIDSVGIGIAAILYLSTRWTINKLK